MNKSELEKEINEASERIKTRQSEIETEIDRLGGQISKFTNWAWAFVWIGAFVSAFALIYFICTNTETGFGLNLLGDFMAGTVASVWSLAGLFFIYVAFLGQKQQLLNQQLEIMYSQLEVKYTRLELSGQKAEMAEQNKTLRRQRFENTFFQLLSNHQGIVNGIDLKRVNNGTWTTSAEGRDCFSIFYERAFPKSVRRIKETIEPTIKRYAEFYKANQSDLGHYFRHIYHILKFIKNSKELTKDEKYNYTNLLRALLSSYELLFIFYNGLSEQGKPKLKLLLEEFSMLKNMDFELLINIEHKNEYKKIAFASSEERKKLLRTIK